MGTATFWLALAGTAVLIALGRRQAERRMVWAASLGLLGAGRARPARPRATPGSDRRGGSSVPTRSARPARRRADRPPGPFRIRARDILYPDLRAWSNGFEKININDSFQIQHAADLYQTLYALLYRPAARPPTSR